MSRSKTIFFQKLSPSQWFLLLLGIIYLSLQIPFIKADPDKNISSSRGANTDEGLHASQIRNYIHHGTLDLNESDNFIKTPLFGAYLYLPILCFGSSLSVVRWAMVFPFFLFVLWIAWRHSYFEKLMLFLIPLVFLEYHVFNFSHFSLAEMPSVCFIFPGILLLGKKVNATQIYRRAFSLAILFAVPIFLKIQFLYLTPLLPILFAFYFFRKKESDSVFVRTLLFASVFFFILMGLYFLFWYLPNQEIFDYVMYDQTSNRWARYFDLPNHLKWVNQNIFLEKKLRPTTIAFYFIFPLGLFLFFKKHTSPFFKKLFLGLGIWLLLETHKMGMMYLPTRYFVSFIFCMAAINALVIFEMVRIYFFQKKKKWLAIAPLSIFVILLLFNLKNYSDTYSRRTFSIQKINQYLEKYEFGDRPIIGAWAPSLTWKTNAKTYPVWGDYFNDKDIFPKQNPAIIIAEIDEKDSSQAYQSQGMNIDEYADSIRYFQVHDFKLKILWIKDSHSK